MEDLSLQDRISIKTIRIRLEHSLNRTKNFIGRRLLQSLIPTKFDPSGPEGPVHANRDKDFK